MSFGSSAFAHRSQSEFTNQKKSHSHTQSILSQQTLSNILSKKLPGGRQSNEAKAPHPSHLNSFATCKEPHVKSLGKSQTRMYTPSHQKHESCSSVKKEVFMFDDETEYTYKPQIHELPQKIYPDHREKVEISKEGIFQRLVQNLKEKELDLKILKVEKEEKEFKANCSFKPEINEVSKRIANQKFRTKTQGNVNSQTMGAINTDAIFDRLYNQGKEKLKCKSLLFCGDPSRQGPSIPQFYGDREMKDCTFQPEINSVSKKILNQPNKQTEPLHMRLNQVMEEKRQKQKVALNEQKKALSCQSWKIQNKETLQIIEQKQRAGTREKDIVKRLLNDYQKEKQLKKEQTQREEQEKYESLYPFKPTLLNNLLVESSGHEQDFLQRQKNYEEKMKENLSHQINAVEPRFQPQINKISQLLTKNRQSETLDEKLNRWNYESYVNKAEKYDDLQASVYRECTFQPSINTISKAVDPEPKSHSCNCVKKTQNFDFKPKINEKSRKILQKKKVLLQTDPNREQMTPKKTRQQHLNRIQMEKEYQDLVECTFKPKTKSLNKRILQENTVEAVAGMKSYMEKNSIAKRKKQQELELKEKLFNLEKRYKARVSETKIREFKLTKPQDSKKPLMQEHEQKFRKECTFTPNIR